MCLSLQTRNVSGLTDCEDKARASSVPAVKTCLKCEVSMCAEHLKPHRELPAFRNHQLTEPMADFWKRKCPTHNIIYSHYCMDHKVYLCNICSTGHSGHNVRTLENAMKDIKVWLFNDLCRLEKSYSLTEKTLKEQEENERRTKSFLDTCLTELMGKLQDMVLTYVRQLQDMVVFHYQISADSIQENISRILVDQARLQDVRCAIESLLLENDPFRLIEDYQIKRNEFTEKLQQNLSELEHSHFPLEEVTTLIKNKTNAFIHEELLSMVAENTATFTSLCHPLEESPVGDFRSSEEDIDDDADLAFNVLHPNIPEEVLENNDHSTDEGEEDFESDEGHDDGLFSDVTDPGEEEEEEEEEGEEEEEEGYVDEDEAEEQEEEEDEEQGGEEEDGDENEYEYGSSDADDE
ncbi:E3 ubiquitin/ISG15 ligase TRIM25-like isoform 2-T2 [Synchiropus picturatus]